MQRGEGFGVKSRHFVHFVFFLPGVRSVWGLAAHSLSGLSRVGIFAGQAAPSADTAMFFFETERLHFSPEFLGRIQLCQGLAELLGAKPPALPPPHMPSSQHVPWQSTTPHMQCGISVRGAELTSAQ